MTDQDNTKRVEWDFMEDDEADFLRKTLNLLHAFYQDKPADFIVISGFLIQKRLEEIDGPQINDLNWKGLEN